MAAGGINAVAGGGTLVSFPALIWAGLNHRQANVTSTVALLPGSLGGAVGFLPELKASHRWLRLLALPSLAGGLLGGWLLLRTPPTFFKSLVPFLILGATLLMAVQDPLRARLEARRINSVPGVIFFQFLVGVYGGYFGAAQGIILMGILGSLSSEPIQRLNGYKNVLATIVNGVAALVFIIVAHDQIDWLVVLLIAIGATIGGVIGSTVGRRLPPPVLRAVIVVIGVVAIVKLVRYP